MTTLAELAGRIPRPFYFSPDAELAEYRRRIAELGGRPAERSTTGTWGRTVRQGYVFPDESFLAFL